jgi:hypothetical protein
MKALGVLPGVFDLLLICPDGRHMWLEAKSDAGRLSPEQQWFKGELILRGVPICHIPQSGRPRDICASE